MYIYIYIYIHTRISLSLYRYIYIYIHTHTIMETAVPIAMRCAASSRGPLRYTFACYANV